MAMTALAVEIKPNHALVNFPFPVNRPSAYDNVTLKGRVYLDPAKPIKGAVVYFHGSGAAGTITGPLVETLVNAEYLVLAINNFGSGDSSADPFKYNYGNVTSPEFTQRFIKTAYWVKAAVVRMLQLSPASNPYPIVLLGHSMGASAVLAYLAGYTSEHGPIDSLFRQQFKGAIVNGATIGGLGDNSWNDVNRNINSLSGIVNLVEGKVIMNYSDNDPYCPPDYAKRLQSAIRPGSEIYFTSSGARGHDWINSSNANAQRVRNWVNQLMNDEPIRNFDGSLAKAGPV